LTRGAFQFGGAFIFWPGGFAIRPAYQPLVYQEKSVKSVQSVVEMAYFSAESSFDVGLD
jgi:hypothetical protein